MFGSKCPQCCFKTLLRPVWFYLTVSTAHFLQCSSDGHMMLQWLSGRLIYTDFCAMFVKVEVEWQRHLQECSFLFCCENRQVLNKTALVSWTELHEKIKWTSLDDQNNFKQWSQENWMPTARSRTPVENHCRNALGYTSSLNCQLYFIFTVQLCKVVCYRRSKILENLTVIL